MEDRFCGNCGNKCAADSKFCRQCGTSLDKSEITQRDTGLERFYHDKNEKLVSVLGQGYLTSLWQSHFDKCVLILTDKRLYQEGKIFFRSGDSLSSRKGSSVLAVKDVTACEFEESNRPMLAVGGVILGIVAVFLFFVASANRGEITVFVYIMSAVFALFAYKALYSYSKARLRVFTIRYAGGAMTVDCRWYSEREMRDFQKGISMLKDASQQI